MSWINDEDKMTCCSATVKRLVFDFLAVTGRLIAQSEFRLKNNYLLMLEKSGNTKVILVNRKQTGRVPQCHTL